MNQLEHPLLFAWITWLTGDSILVIRSKLQVGFEVTEA